MNIRNRKLQLLGSGLLLAGSHAAYAVVQTNHSGTICKAYNASEQLQADYYVSGTESSGSATAFICPLVRQTTATRGATAQVNIYHFGFYTSSCTLHSFKTDATALGSVSGTVTASGAVTINLPLGNGKSVAGSNYSVLCTIPPAGGARIININLKEN